MAFARVSRPGERLGDRVEVGLAGEVALGQGVGQLLQGFAPEDDVGVLADQLATGAALGVAPLGLRPGGGVAVPEVQAARGEGWADRPGDVVGQQGNGIAAVDVQGR